ncbi:MAG TPA: hypothetical protein VEA36_01390 [Candidatus Paceibacterota bacterium]|nr:hypothetical protein [Candidatus Paceibacterota bacterium]
MFDAPLDTAQERVAAGAALLDAQAPGWRDRIDVDRLSIQSCGRCMLAQLYGNYARGVKHLGLDANGTTVRNGFNAGPGVSFSELDRAWKAQILTPAR